MRFVYRVINRDAPPKLGAMETTRDVRTLKRQQGSSASSLAGLLIIRNRRPNATNA
jgi:hypothetical protein